MSIEGAKGVLLNISGGPSLSLQEIHEAASVIYEQADENSNIILGSVIDPSMNDEVIVTVIATGCENCGEAITTVEENLQEFEEDTNPEAETIQASVRDEEIEEVEEQREEEKPVEYKIEAADLSNLDVPTFLRKELEEEQKAQE